MLEHIGQAATAERICRALDSVVLEGRARTRDMGGSASTGEFTDALVRALG
jgi:isocitrate/isopropylmalate dehydrogenase